MNADAASVLDGFEDQPERQPPMRLADLIPSIEAEPLTAGRSDDAEIERVYAGDRISDLLNQGTRGTLLVTNLTGVQILRLAELMEVPALCLVGGVAPEPELVRSLRNHGTVLVVSPFGMFETCGRLYRQFEAACEIPS